MATPILLIKINPKVYTKDQFSELKERVSIKCHDYHCFVISSEQVNDISFEVHGESFTFPKCTGDLVTRIQGKDMEFIINKNNDNRKRS